MSRNSQPMLFPGDVAHTVGLLRDRKGVYGIEGSSYPQDNRFKLLRTLSLAGASTRRRKLARPFTHGDRTSDTMINVNSYEKGPYLWP